MEKVAVLGLGYIGLPTAIIAAEAGYVVHGFDTDSVKVKQLAAGDATFVEPELAPRLTNVVASGALTVAHVLEPAHYYIIAVPTPLKENKRAELSHVYAAAHAVAGIIREGDTVIIESTIPVGVSRKVATLIASQSGFFEGHGFFVAHCPERVIPGSIFEELISNDRVIGGVSLSARDRAHDFYRRFVKGSLYVTDDKTAEMSKLVENSFRDVSIAFANSVAAVSKEAGTDPFEVIACANRHPRVNILSPGAGVGGHCIAVDPWFLIEKFPKETALLKQGRRVNVRRPRMVLADVVAAAKRHKKQRKRQPRVLVLGMTFKADTDDMRLSPALEIIEALKTKRRMLSLTVCDPYVAAETFVDLHIATTQHDVARAIAEHDIVVALVAHKAFSSVDLGHLAGKVVIDACGLFSQFKSSGTPIRFGGARVYNDDTSREMQ